MPTPERLAPDHAFVISLRYETDPATRECTLTLHLARDDSPISATVTIEFTGIVAFTIPCFSGAYPQIVGLEVEDISGEQLDHINWRVSDFEDGAIEFMCRSYRMTGDASDDV